MSGDITAYPSAVLAAGRDRSQCFPILPHADDQRDIDTFRRLIESAANRRLIKQNGGLAERRTSRRQIENMLVIVYLIMCFIIGIAGRRRRLGFFGFFLLSVVLTPVVTLGWLLISHRRFLAREVAAGHLVICADCAGIEARAAADLHQRCIRCGAPV